MENLARVEEPLQKYITLIALQDRNEALFYRVLIDHIEEMMPIIYTPTVGKACQQYGHIFRRPRGLFITSKDRGRVAQVMRNWPHWDVQCIVVTDGERILGLGDLGAGGMGIPVGKLALYTACAGLDPARCLPVVLDVGTNNQTMLDCPLYVGLKQPRLRGEEYDALVEEFYTAAAEVFPRAMVQLEDFANGNAFRLLERYRDKSCTFDDDIQGTGAVALAGLLTALRKTKRPMEEQRVLFFGAGEAAIGIADLIVTALRERGLSEKEARERCWFIDSKGLVIAERTDLVEHKRPFAHEHAPIRSLEEAVATLKPTALIGVSSVGGAFGEDVLKKMGELNETPIIFALSNPTDNAECTAAQAYGATGGRAVFASGSPFPPVELNGKTIVSGQGNNAYIFPGVGLGVILSEARVITDEMFYASARALADQVTDEELERGSVYPDLGRIRDVSARIAAAVAEVAYERGLTSQPRPDADLVEIMRASMYDPRY